MLHKGPFNGHAKAEIDVEAFHKAYNQQALAFHKGL